MYHWKPKEFALINEKRISDCKGICNEGKRTRMAAPTVDVPLKTQKTTYLKKWGLEKYRRPPAPKPLKNLLESIDLDDFDGLKGKKLKNSSSAAAAVSVSKSPREPLATSAQIKALKRQHKLDEEMGAKRLKRQRVTAALRKQGIKAVFKSELIGNEKLSGVAQKQQRQQLLKAGSKRKL